MVLKYKIKGYDELKMLILYFIVESIFFEKDESIKNSCK